MRLMARFIFCLLLFPVLAWLGGVRIHLEALTQGLPKAQPADMQDLLMKDGKILSGRIVAQTDGAVTLEIEKGVALDLPKSQIVKIGKSVSANTEAPRHSTPIFSYNKKQNYFLIAVESVVRAFKIFTYDNYTDAERKEHAKNLKAGYEWQLGGGRERMQQTLDMAARKSLGPYAKYMKGGSAEPPPAPTDRRS